MSGEQVSTTASRSIFQFFVLFVLGSIFLCGLLWAAPTTIGEVVAFLSSLGELRYLAYGGFAVGAYLVGGIISSSAYVLYEKVFIGNHIGYPSENLFFRESRHRSFKGYKRPYSEQFASQFNHAFTETFGSGYGHRDILMLSFSVVKERCPQTYARLTTFKAQYDFARNNSFCFGILGILLLIGGIARRDWLLAGTSCLSGFLCIAFFYRYLEFFRCYVDEIFRAFFEWFLACVAIHKLPSQARA